MSPATPFLVASLPNHTKMFELVHVVTSMEDFGWKRGSLGVLANECIWAHGAQIIFGHLTRFVTYVKLTCLIDNRLTSTTVLCSLIKGQQHEFFLQFHPVWDDAGKLIHEKS